VSTLSIRKARCATLRNRALSESPMQLSSNVLVPLIEPPKSSFNFKLRSCSNPNPNSLQADTLKTLEWSSVCKQLSPFTSTSMGSAAALSARLPIGRTPAQSQKLLDQTSAARLLAQPLDFSGIDDLTEILRVAASGHLLTIRELCTVRRTLAAARGLFDSLKRFASASNHPQRYSLIFVFWLNCISKCLGCDDCAFFPSLIMLEELRQLGFSSFLIFTLRFLGPSSSNV